MQSGLTVTGLDGVLQNMAKMGQHVKAQGIQALSETLDEVLGLAQGACPVKSGYLRSTLQKYQSNDGLHGEVFTDCSYAFFPEFGTRFMRAQPYLFPSWITGVSHFKERIKGSMTL